jgi:zinc transporter, ZIP family
MRDAVLFGIVASSALVIGGALGSFWRAPGRVTGVMLAFASGTLVSALAFELFPEAVHLGGLAPAGWGLMAGAATFVIINTWLDSRVAQPHTVRRQAGRGTYELERQGTPKHVGPAQYAGWCTLAKLASAH